jgi:predicted small metal-binding protein
MERAEFFYSLKNDNSAERKEGINMAGKTYKQISCRDAGADCDFMVRAETEEELLKIVADHACRGHNMCEFSTELREKVLSHIKTVSV